MTKRIAKTMILHEVMEQFSTEHRAVRWLEGRRWGNDPICGHCGGTDKIRRQENRKFTYWCGDCRGYFTVSTNTMIAESKLSIRLWLLAIYTLMTVRKGISGLQLSKELGITQKTSWFLCHRIREACAKSSERFMLRDIVEIDETYTGGKESNEHAHQKLHMGRGAVGKAVVVGARQRGSTVRMQAVPNSKREAMTDFIDRHVKNNSKVFTDEHRSYSTLDGHRGIKHETVNHGTGEYVGGDVNTNSIEGVWGVLKRGINDIYRHVSVKHLNRYVQEFIFRLNEGNYKVDTIDRMQSLAKCMTGTRLTYATLIARGV